MIGIGIIILSLALLFTGHGFSREGKSLSILAALMAVATLSLYKYDITHYNSVEAEQFAIFSLILIVLLVVARVRTGENLFKYFTKPLFLFQSMAAGIAAVLISFAYIYAPASIVLTSKRSVEVMASIASGHFYFKEKKLGLKIFAFCLLVTGLVLLAI